MRGIAGQPQLVRTPPSRQLHLALSDSLSIRDSVTATLVGVGIPSAEAFGVAAVGGATEHDQARPVTPAKRASGRSTVSGGGQPHSTGHATHGRPERRAEVEWHLMIAAPSMALGQVITGTAEGALGFAAGGVIVAHLLWEFWLHPPNS